MIPVIAKLLLSLAAPPKPKCGKIVAYATASLFLLVGSVVACFSLYHYLIPEIGQVLTLAFLASIFLSISLLLFFVGWLLRPKNKILTPLESMHPILENVLKPVIGEKESHQLLASLPHHLPLVSLVALVGLAAYWASHTKSSVA
ncbi:MAG: hypothetical protein B7Y25_04700 [Alphaproteobacteria bacterium 16-39-46]|nr:MAG: hypothetical protein B7Y25_04700 [Alphaproteobacteria bacterium 16-39-46]OZA42897.1 MAG: hypothetical protein B7X84_04525 [Alphaproteobacteria bacterium 17-39-52]HQS84238.1 hypothetical protein [Alphaproteobacteria bacterium]HQS94059.1 hypothetical protein [Alphaproteobacteria bacterium]